MHCQGTVDHCQLGPATTYVHLSHMHPRRGCASAAGVTSVFGTAYGAMLFSIEITSSDGDLVQKAELFKDPMGSVWKSNWVPDRVGRFNITIDHPLLSGLPELNRDTAFDVVRPDDEFRVLDTDHDLLERIASESGGTTVPIDSIERIVNLLPNRDVLIENPIVVPIWNSGTFLFLLIGLLTTEWVGRRLIRMT